MAARFDACKGIGFKSVESADKGERGTAEEGIVRGGNDDDFGGGGSSRECRAAFWVSGFVPRPLTSVHPRNSPSLPPALPPPPPLRPRTKFGKAAVRAAHECGTVGQRTPWPPPTAAYPPSSVHAPWCDTLPSSCCFAPSRRPFIRALSAPYFFLSLPFLPAAHLQRPVVSSRQRLRYCYAFVRGGEFAQFSFDDRPTKRLNSEIKL